MSHQFTARASGPVLKRPSPEKNDSRKRGEVLRRATALTLSAACLVSGVAPAAWAQSGPTTAPVAPSGAFSEAQPVTVDDPQPKDAFSVDPFAEAAPDPAAVPQEGSAGGDVKFDAAAETVEIHVSDADLLDVLRMLSVQSHKNIVASREVHGTVTCNLFDVTVEEALDAILRSNGFVAREEGNFIYVYTQEELAAIEEQNREQETRVFRLYHTPPEMAAEMVKPALSQGATISFSDEADDGIGSDREQAGGFSFSSGDAIVVRDYPERLDEVERLLQEVDQRPQQVLIEATILSTRLDENNAFGVDFNVVGGVDFSEFVTSNGQITGGEVGDAPGNSVHGVGTGTNFTDQINGGLKVGFVSNNVSAFVAALEGITDTSVLANPKVLALNKQKGEVLVGSKDGYITTTLTETSATQTVEFLDTGTSLIFRPFISRDGYVRLEIHPEDSIGGVDDRGLPFKRTTEVTSNVMVKDGHTIVIGGLFRESATSNRSQVPVLGNIPLLGALFRRQADVTQREEIIILLTPHIVKDHEAYSALSEEELKRAEKHRVGIRKGMMPTGRERMAQMNYEKAIREMAKDRPNRGRARFYLNAATNLNPSFIEAIELKERLTGRVVVEADQSTIRSFLRRAVIEDVGMDKPDNDPVVPEPVDLLPENVDAQGKTGLLQTADAPEVATLAPTSPAHPTTKPSDEPALVSEPSTRPSRMLVMMPTTKPAAPTTRPAEADEDVWVDADE